MAGVANVDALLAHGEWVRELVRHLVFDRDVADDVVQQTYLAALEHPPAKIASPRGWLAQVARRFAFQAQRTDIRRKRYEPNAARPEAYAPDVDRRIELHRMLVDAVASLEEPYRTVVVLRYFEGSTPRDIAKVLGIPATTVRNRLNRALEQLRARFDRERGGRKAWTTALLPLAIGSKASAAIPAAAAAAGALLLTGAIVLLAIGSGRAARDAAPAPLSDGHPGPAAAIVAATEQPRPAPAAPQAPSRPAVSGRVVRADGAPAAGAAISLFPPLRRSPNAEDWFTRSRRQFEPTAPLATTAALADGSFTITAAADSYDVMADLAGAGRAIVEEVVASTDAAPLTMTLEPVDLVPCIAVDAQGAPVAGVEIAVEHCRSFDPHFNRPRTERLATDAAGRFTIARARGDLSDARFVVIERFTGPGWWQHVSLRKHGYAPIFSAPLSQQPIDEEGRAVFTMRRGRRFEIGFRSEDPIDQKLRCMLRLDSAHYEGIGEANEQNDIVFDDVPEGTIAGVILDTPGWAMMRNPVVDGMRSRFCARQYRVPKSGDVTMEVIVHRGASVSGVVVDELTGAPVNGVEVVMFPNAGYLASSTHLVRAVSDEQGRFAISGLTAIWNELRVASREWFAPPAPPSPSTPEAPELGFPDLVSTPPIIATRRTVALALLVLPDPESPVRDLVIKVRRSGRAAGTVVDERGDPVANARVSVERSEEATRLCPAPVASALPVDFAVTDARGRFELAFVPPGTQRLVARAPGCGPALSDAFAVAAGGSAQAPPITVRPGAPLTIRVRSDRGRPIAGVGVKIYADRFPRDSIGPDDFAGRTNEAGVLTARSLPSGPICLAVENETRDGLVLAPTFRSTFIHDASSADEIVVEMVEPSVIRGSIELEDGTPVKHATLIATPAFVSRNDVAAIEDMIGRGPLDWNRFGTEDGIQELSGIRAHTDASGAFAVRVNSPRPLVVRRIERWRRGEAGPTESFTPLDRGAMLVPDGPRSATITVKRSRR